MRIEPSSQAFSLSALKAAIASFFSLWLLVIHTRAFVARAPVNLTSTAAFIRVIFRAEGTRVIDNSASRRNIALALLSFSATEPCATGQIFAPDIRHHARAMAFVNALLRNRATQGVILLTIQRKKWEKHGKHTEGFKHSSPRYAPEGAY